MTEYGDNESYCNYAYYDNQTFRDLCASGYENDSINHALSEQCYYEAQEMLMNESVSAPLFDVNDIFGMRNEIMGFQSNPHYPRVIFFYDLYEVVIPEFSDFLIPMIGMLFIFLVVRKKKEEKEVKGGFVGGEK